MTRLEPKIGAQYLAELNATSRSIQDALDRFAKSISFSLLPALSPIAGDKLRFPDELRDMVQLMVERGWFISARMDVSHLQEFKRLHKASQISEIDTLMSKWIDQEIPRILESAVQLFPDRQTILEAAISAHHNGQFVLSVPVLLIQVEGMCVEKLGEKLYASNNGVPKTKAATEYLIRGTLSEVIFLPLREFHGLTAREKNRGKWPEAPNRHEIMHGIVTDYGTRLNSLKALSLLDYFVTFVASDTKSNPTNG